MELRNEEHNNNVGDLSIGKGNESNYLISQFSSSFLVKPE
jgi:hypothetical protein